MLIFLNRETTVMSKYNNSTTPALFQGSELINAMRNACTESIWSYAKDSDSPSGLSVVTLFGFDVAGATMYARVIQKLGLIITPTDCDIALAHTFHQVLVNMQTTITLALRGSGFTEELLNELDFVQTSHENLWTKSDADLVLEVLPFLRDQEWDSRSGLTLDYAIELQTRIKTIDVYWQTAGSNSYVHLPTVLRDVRRERKEHGKSLHRIITSNGGVYSRTDSTLRAPWMYGHPGITGSTALHTRTVRCDVDTYKYVAHLKDGCCKLFHLWDKPRPVSKATTEEGLGAILSAMWGLDSGFAGSAYHRLGYLTRHYAPALLVTTLVDNKGAAWVVAKHHENWAASRLTARSRATVVQIYT